MTDSPSLEDTIATVLAQIRDQFPGDIVYTEATHGSMLQALLDEEGPEALVEAVLRAASVVLPDKPCTQCGRPLSVNDWCPWCHRYEDEEAVSVVPPEPASHDGPAHTMSDRGFIQFDYIDLGLASVSPPTSPDEP